MLDLWEIAAKEVVAREKAFKELSNFESRYSQKSRFFKDGGDSRVRMEEADARQNLMDVLKVREDAAQKGAKDIKLILNETLTYEGKLM